MGLQRYKLTIAYRGTHYHGWQRQLATKTYKGPKPPPGRGIPTIQETVSRALVSVVRHPIVLSGSSRTDAGVHAKGQVAHFDSDQNIPTKGMRLAINHALPDDILVRSIEPVPDSFDAVQSTLCKRYQYYIWNEEDRPVHFADQAWHRWRPLDIPAMEAAAAHFLGQHDFTSFSRPGHGRESAIRTIHECSLSVRGPRLIFGVEGSGFLWHMVRIMVGTLVQVGMSELSPDVIPKMLEAKDRKAAGATAPPEGLFLHWIKFRPTSEAATQSSPQTEPAESPLE